MGKHGDFNPLPPNFDPEEYLSINNDVAMAGQNPREHWISHGFFEGRKYCNSNESFINQKVREFNNSVLKSIDRARMGLIGIGIITFNRKSSLERLLESIFASEIQNSPVVVFEDGSDSSDIVSKYPALHVRGNSNQGVIVNKNRALHHFWSIEGVDQVILLEDDLAVSSRDWLGRWSKAIEHFGHLNYNPVSASDEVSTSNLLTGQVHGLKLNSLTKWLGYLDPNFKGYGHGHSEWTFRHLRCSQGGYFNSLGQAHFVNYGYGIANVPGQTFRDENQTARNGVVFRQRISKPKLSPRPWLDEAGRAEFMDFEIRDNRRGA